MKWKLKNILECREIIDRIQNSSNREDKVKILKRKNINERDPRLIIEILEIQAKELEVKQNKGFSTNSLMIY